MSEIFYPLQGVKSDEEALVKIWLTSYMSQFGQFWQLLNNKSKLTLDSVGRYHKHFST